jgi:hypothetical protein
MDFGVDMTRTPVPASEPTDTVNVNFRMSEQERRDLKLWCVEQDMTMTDALVSGAAVLRKLVDQFGPGSPEAILDAIGAVEIFLIDRQGVIRVERLEGDSWVVREGMNFLVNRDGHLEHADGADVERTAFRLPEALRIARARVDE